MQLPKITKIKISLFVLFAFSIYYSQYFRNFSQGDVAGRSIFVDMIKLFSVILFISTFCTYKKYLNRFDFVVVVFISLVTISYLVGGIFYGFNDLLFFNFLIFACLYPFFKAINSKEKILYSYKVLAIVIFVQVIFDALLNQLEIRLWDGGLFVGGLGNPSSFGFMVLFCLIYLILEDSSFQNKYRFLFCVAYVYAVLMTNALFPILLVLSFISITALCIRSNIKKATLVFSALFALLLFFSTTDLEHNLLWNKVDSLFYFLGWTDGSMLARATPPASISISTRAGNARQALEFLLNPDFSWFLGHHKNLAYYAVDSQYIAFLFSFGVLVLIYFLAFNIWALLHAWRNIKNNNAFIFASALIFGAFFVNNRILDYFPIGYIYISLLLLISLLKDEQVVNDDI